MASKIIESRFVSGPDDGLAVSDVYEITENAIRSRASGIGDEELSALMGLLRIPFEALEEFLEPILDFINDILDWLKERIADFIALLPFDLKEFFSGDDNGIDVGTDMLGYASLDMLWDYAGELIYIDPANKATYEAARAAVAESRRKKGQNPNGISKGVDQGAETIVYSELIKRMLGADIGPPIAEIIEGLSDDRVRRNVCEACMPTAINPKSQTGPNPATLSPNEPQDWNTPNPTEGTVWSPAYNVADKFTPDGTGTFNPWEGITIGPDGIPVGADGEPVTNWEDYLEARENGRLDWTTPPSDVYCDNVQGGPGSGNGGTGQGSSSNGTGSQSSPNGTGSNGQGGNPHIFDQQDIELAPGYRDNAPPWVNRNPSDGGGFDWGAIEDLKRWTTPDRLMAKYPGLLSMILYYYAYPGDEFSVEEEYLNLIGTMDWLKEGWAETKRDDVTIGKLLYFSSASRDAIDLLSRYPDSQYREEIMIAGSYRYNSIAELLKVQYPQAAI